MKIDITQLKPGDIFSHIGEHDTFMVISDSYVRSQFDLPLLVNSDNPERIVYVQLDEGFCDSGYQGQLFYYPGVDSDRKMMVEVTHALYCRRSSV